MMRATFFWRGRLLYANRSPKESPADAIARALTRRTGGQELTLSYSGRGPDYEMWTARYFDPSSDTFKEEEVDIANA